MNNDFNYRTYDRISVGMQSQENRNLQFLRGKVLLNENDKSLLFIQNNPRGPRSIEVFRTGHSRLVRRSDGNCTLTFRFNPNEPGVLNQLLAEMETIVSHNMFNYIN